MATEIFDASPYVRVPIVNVSNGITLGHALVAGCPAGVAPNVTKSCNRLKAAIAAAENAVTERRRKDREVTEEDSRIVDQTAGIDLRSPQLTATHFAPFGERA